MLNEKSYVSLYHQLKERLVQKIKSNEWPIDSKIPTERELCDLYKVSRITVRQALDELEKEGLLYRKQGRGTFVTAPKIEQRLSHFYSFSEELRRMGYTPETKVLAFSVADADEVLSRRLKVEKGEAVYGIRRLRLANGKAYAVETSYIPCRLCPGLSEEEVKAKGLYDIMKGKYGILPQEAVETFEAVILSREDATSLGAGKNAPGLHLDRFTYADGRVVEYCNCMLRGDVYKYSVTLKLD